MSWEVKPYVRVEPEPAPGTNAWLAIAPPTHCYVPFRCSRPLLFFSGLVSPYPCLWHHTLQRRCRSDCCRRRRLRHSRRRKLFRNRTSSVEWRRLTLAAALKLPASVNSANLPDPVHHVLTSVGG